LAKPVEQAKVLLGSWARFSRLTSRGAPANGLHERGDSLPKTLPDEHDINMPVGRTDTSTQIR